MGRVVATLFLLLVTIPAAAEQSGVVFSDDNANGERDPGEAPRQAIAVTNGRDVVVTGADLGVQRLDELQHRLVKGCAILGGIAAATKA